MALMRTRRGRELSPEARAAVVLATAALLAIASALSGNVLAGRQNVGLALGLVMVVVIAVVMVGYLLLQRRASRWTR